MKALTIDRCVDQVGRQRERGRRAAREGEQRGAGAARGARGAGGGGGRRGAAAPAPARLPRARRGAHRADQGQGGLPRALLQGWPIVSHTAHMHIDG